MAIFVSPREQMNSTAYKEYNIINYNSIYEDNLILKTFYPGEIISRIMHFVLSLTEYWWRSNP